MNRYAWPQVKKNTEKPACILVDHFRYMIQIHPFHVFVCLDFHNQVTEAIKQDGLLIYAEKE